MKKMSQVCDGKFPSLTRNTGHNTQININKMGLYGAVSYIIGNILGAGLFITPTAVLEQVDSVGLSLIIWTVAAVISVLGAFCYVELGTSIRTSGADFAYLCYVKWYPLAFAFMCIGSLVIFPSALAIQTQTFSEYLVKGFQLKIADVKTEFYIKKLIGFSLLWSIMALNFFSLKIFVSRFQIIASVAKIAATAIVICTGFYLLIWKGETRNLENAFQGSRFASSNLLAALFAGLFSYDGWDVLNFGAEEIQKPKKTMPLAIIIGMSVVAFVFLATNVAFFVALTTDQMKSSVAVADTFAAAKLGKLYYTMPFLICVLLIGSINSTLFCASRYLYAAARQGHLPAFLSCTNTVHDSPRVAVFVCVMLSFMLSFAGNLSELISYISFCQWLQRFITISALLWIRFTHKPIHPDAFRNPIIVPILFSSICTALIITTVISNIQMCIIGIPVVICGLMIYFLFLYEYSLPSIQSYQILAYKLNNKITAYMQIMFDAMPQTTSEYEMAQPLLVSHTTPTFPTEVSTISERPKLTIESVYQVISTDKVAISVQEASLRTRKAVLIDVDQQS